MLTFPDRLRVSECTFTGANQSISGGQAMTGFQQAVVSPRGRWTAKLTCQVVGEEEQLVYQAFLGALQGAGNLCLVGPRDGVRPRDASGRTMPWQRAVPWANGAQWFNGAGWAAPLRADASVVGTVAQGATALTIVVFNGRGVRPGHYIGFAGYLYRVLTATPDPNGDPRVQDLTVWPRLRTGAVDALPINLASPVCTMRLKTDDSGELSLRWREQSTPTLEFVEATPVPGQ